MSFSLILNGSNNVNTQTNTQFKYQFLGGNFTAENMEMCISALTIPYSFFNVTQYYNNQSFSIIFPTGATTQTLSITLPAGFYLVSDIENYIQNQCIANGLYLINASGQYVYYFNIYTNTTYYSTQIVCSVLPTSLPTGYSYATSGTYSSLAGLPTTANKVPQLVLPSTGGINTIIGWVAGTFPSSSTQPGGYSAYGTVTPVGSNINSIVMRCSILKNYVTSPSDILDGFPINATFGSNITYVPSFEKWIPINNGTFSNFVLNFVDQNLNIIYAQDPNISVTILIRKKPEKK
jgi:hypothetical protein